MERQQADNYYGEENGRVPPAQGGGAKGEEVRWLFPPGGHSTAVTQAARKFGVLVESGEKRG